MQKQRERKRERERERGGCEEATYKKEERERDIEQDVVHRASAFTIRGRAHAPAGCFIDVHCGIRHVIPTAHRHEHKYGADSAGTEQQWKVERPPLQKLANCMCLVGMYCGGK